MSLKVLNVATSIIHVFSEQTGRWHRPPDPESFAAFCDSGLVDLIESHEKIPMSEWDDSYWSILIREFTHRIQLTPYRRESDFVGVLARSCRSFFTEIARFDFHYISLWSDDYPTLLRQIIDPPLGLIVWGQCQNLDRPGVSVVGSRRASSWALAWASEFGSLASRCGIPVVSGGAYGCDAAVHCGMIRDRYDSVPARAVLASGFANPYPARNQGLFADIVDSGGCLVSERSVVAGCRPWDFLARNRIIAGLSPVTVIVQAAERSGAMVTARAAADQGREVLVVKPPFEDIRASGNCQLLDDGAVPVADPESALEFIKIYLKII